RDTRGLIAMHADRLDLDRYPVALARGEAAVLDHAEALLQRLVGILEDRARDGAGAEVAIVLIVPVGEAFARQPEAERARGLLHLGARQRDIDDPVVDGLDRAADRQRIILAHCR